jgi:8-oxo-dGTP pyrophosphatase MutT (NUDIX family)
VTHFPRIRESLATYSPELKSSEGVNAAAVSMILRPGPTVPEVLLIERAKREGDPWSGHMAFPGGRADPSDSSIQQTGERETLEEVGLSLERADVIGRLDDLGGRAAAANKMVVSAHVYQFDDPGRLVIQSSEVAEAFWVPLDHLTDPDNYVRHVMQYGEHEIPFPGINVGDDRPRVVWGLTYRFLEVFFEATGTPLPKYDTPDQEDFARISE